MSRAPSSAPLPRRPHLRLIAPMHGGDAGSPALRHNHRPRPRTVAVTTLDAAAVIATLYVVVVLLRFLAW